MVRFEFVYLKGAFGEGKSRKRRPLGGSRGWREHRWREHRWRETRGGQRNSLLGWVDLGTGCALGKPAGQLWGRGRVDPTGPMGPPARRTWRGSGPTRGKGAPSHVARHTSDLAFRKLLGWGLNPTVGVSCLISLA